LSTDERARRIGANEAIFREVNERLEAVAHDLGLDGQELDLLCECGDANCVERISIPAADYEALRANPTVFAVAPGHEQRDVEYVIERRKGYDVVQKREGLAARIAEETDPRQ
jgi:hypothetical protein